MRPDAAIASPDQLGRRHQLLLQALLPELVDQPHRHLGAGLGDDLGGLGVDQVRDQLVAAQMFRVERRLPALPGQRIIDGTVEPAEDLLARHAAGVLGLQDLVLLGQLFALGHRLLGV